MRDQRPPFWGHFQFSPLKELLKEGFKSEVERYLTGKETEPGEIIYFKLYKSQLPVVERALEIAALMLGSDKSRGYLLEMVCADFLAGADLQTRESEITGSAYSNTVDWAHADEPST